VGGALRMNAGAYGGEMFQVLDPVRFMDYSGIIRSVPASEIPAGYRNCPFFKTHIALGAVLRGQPAPRADIEQRMNECSRKRWSSQPKAPSAGCAFKNPADIPAGRLVEELGLKGTRVGGARVSMEHGNFIVTEPEARARDVLDLLELIKERARTGRGIELQTEIQIIGEDL
jgi:UDP-N-acetylenolpyruvoylglucosamine reductase